MLISAWKSLIACNVIFIIISCASFNRKCIIFIRFEQSRACVRCLWEGQGKVGRWSQFLYWNPCPSTCYWHLLAALEISHPFPAVHLRRPVWTDWAISMLGGRRGHVDMWICEHVDRRTCGHVFMRTFLIASVIYCAIITPNQEQLGKNATKNRTCAAL
jgi:hypothetical protein